MRRHGLALLVVASGLFGLGGPRPPAALAAVPSTCAVTDLSPVPRGCGRTSRVSVATGGTEANGHSVYSSLSGNGRFVAFESDATNLVANDTNLRTDVFVHDRQTSETTRVSVASGGLQATGHSYSPAISANGRFVAFESSANNLVAGDTNARNDVFVHDRRTGDTARVSVATGGAQSAGGQEPSISADGSLVAFESDATNLVAGDTNARTDVFVHDRQTATTARVSVAPGGAEADQRSEDPAISGNGRYVSFWSEATNLVSGDTNRVSDVFVHDRTTGSTDRASVSSGGVEGDGYSYEPSISAGGRYVAFSSGASNLVADDPHAADLLYAGEGYAVFVHDRTTGKTNRVSVTNSGAKPDHDSFSPAISSDGRYVMFSSYAALLDPGDPNDTLDVFVRDRHARTTQRVSVGPAGVPAMGTNKFGSYGSAISGDGRVVSFHSFMTNLVVGDTNNLTYDGAADVFVHDRRPDPLAAASPVAAPPIVTVEESPVGFATCDLLRQTDDAWFCLLGQENAAGDFVVDWSYVTAQGPTALTERMAGRAVVADLPSVTDSGFVKALHWESTVPGLGPIVVDVAPFYGDEEPSQSDSNLICSGDFQMPGVQFGQRHLRSSDAVIYVANVSATIDGALVDSYRDNCSAFWFGPTSGMAVLQPGG